MKKYKMRFILPLVVEETVIAESEEQAQGFIESIVEAYNPKQYDRNIVPFDVKAVSTGVDYTAIALSEQEADVDVVTWPESQDYMDKNGFREHSKLINGVVGLDIYGSSAYVVDKKWKEDIDNGKEANYGETPKFADLDVDFEFPICCE